MAHNQSRVGQNLGKLFSRVWSSSGYTLTQFTKRESFYHKADSHLRTFLLNFKPQLSEGKSQWLINGTSSAMYSRHFQTNKSQNLKQILNKGLQIQIQLVGRARSGRANEEFEQLVRRWRLHTVKQFLGLHSRSFTSWGFRSPHLTSGSPRINQHVFHKRFYYVDQRGVQHFKRRGPIVWVQGSAGGDRQQKIVIFLGILACGSAYIYYNNLQTVPYTHRRHFVLISPSMEKALGEQEFINLKREFQSTLLPPIHPETVRVRRIAKEVIEAVLAGAKAQHWGKVEHGYSPAEMELDPWREHQPVQKDSFNTLEHKHLYGDEKLDDNRWVEESRKKGLEEGTEGFTAHLENLKWEVLVVDKDAMNAFCLPGGKIVVFTGLLKQFRSDPEIATVLAHEVGHVVARHAAEKLTQGVWLGFLQLLILSMVFVPGLINSTADLLLRLPFSRRMESEADHIGLLLMAAAGYDPRLAPGFYEKMGALEKTPEYLQYLSTHPSGKTRGELLRKTGTMQDAVEIYEEKRAGRGREGFL